MFYAKILNGQVIQYPCSIENGAPSECVEVQLTSAPFCETYENVVFDGLECVDAVWRQKWRIEPATQQQIENRQLLQAQVSNMTFEQLASIEVTNV